MYTRALLRNVNNIYSHKLFSNFRPCSYFSDIFENTKAAFLPMNPEQKSLNQGGDATTGIG